MKVKCPHCGHINEAPDEYAGKRVNCPRCKKPHFAVAYDGGVVLADAVIAKEVAKKTKPPPEPAVPTLLPIVGGLAAILGLLSIPVMLVSLNIVGVVAGVVGFLGGLTVMAVAEIQGHAERTAYWTKQMCLDSRKRDEGEKK